MCYTPCENGHMCVPINMEFVARIGGSDKPYRALLYQYRGELVFSPDLFISFRAKVYLSIKHRESISRTRTNLIHIVIHSCPPVETGLTHTRWVYYRFAGHSVASSDIHERNDEMHLGKRFGDMGDGLEPPGLTLRRLLATA